MLPVAKIGVGIGLALLGIVLVGVPILGWPVLAIGVIYLLVGIDQRRKPEWRIRALLHQAHHHPESANAAIQEALAIDSGNPEALAASAGHEFAKGNWHEAASLYEGYLAKAPTDWRAETHLAASLLNAGDPDRAIPHFQKLRQLPGLPEESQLRLTTALAAAFLQKDDGEQALEILKTLPLLRRTLDEPLQQALYLRALSHYQKGEKSRAISDLDRLYALNPSYPGLEQVKAEVTAGTFSTKGTQASSDYV